MRKDEAEQIINALEGLMAHIDTVRTLVKQSIEVEIKPMGCSHENARDISTHGDSVIICDDCSMLL